MVAFDSYSSDDEEDKCPLCIEDMDITDKNFKPCPCGFQICQFCYNNIRSGPEQYNRCPACRRPYDDESIEYKTLTPEEMKQEQERKQRKEQMRKQRERERNKELHHPHFDQRDKKHLANVRVIQKNLVYVIGLNPNIPSEDLQQMLRKDEYFGQYGKIQKIVVNKRVNGNGNLGVGVYVTFARKEDAARCIAAVDGSINDGKYLRAAYGTTKYCSSYLRGQNCPNHSCMFLHEPGEEADSFNRHPNHQQQQPGQLQGSAPPSSGGHHSSASASPVPAPMTLSSHGTVNGATPNPHTPASVSTFPATHAQSPGPTTIPLASAAAPPPTTLPAWSKATSQIPAVQKLAEHDLPNPAEDSLRLLQRNLASLSSESWDFQFVTDIQDTETPFPAMFSLPLDDKRRLKSYNKAIAELDRLLQKQQNSTEHIENEASAQSREDGKEQTSSPAPSDSKAEAKKNNSQHLLAHLMRGVSPVSPQLVRQEEDTERNSFTTTEAASEFLDTSESNPAPTRQKRLDPSAAMAMLDRFQNSGDQLHGLVAGVMRQIGGDLMQPAAPVRVETPDNVDLKSTKYADDGPSFDLANLPMIPIAGDTAPSVWYAMEELTRERERLSRREKEFVSAKAQTKKRMKRIRV